MSIFKKKSLLLLNSLNKFILPVVLIIISVLVYWRWVFLNEIFTYGDWIYWYDNAVLDLYSIPQTWNNTSFGLVDFNLSSSLIYYILGFLQKFSEYKFSIKLLYFFPVVFVLPISTYILSLNILKNKIGAFISTLLFIFNTYFLIGSTGHLTLMAAYSFSPLLLNLYIEFSKNPNFKKSLLLPVFSTLIISYEVRAAYIIFFLMFIYFLFTILDRNIDFKIKFRYFLLNIVFGILLILLNFFWLLPLITTGTIASNQIFSRGLFGDQYLNISNALTTYHPFWSYKGITIFNIQSIPIYYYLLPILMFLGFYFNKSKKDIKYFLLISLLGIFLTKQSSEPFGFFYKYLYDNLPGFNAFREASKFFYLSSLGYSVLIGSFITYLLSLKNKFYSILNTFIITFILFITFTNVSMFINGKVGTLFVPRYVPQDYQNLYENIYSSNDYFRTLWIPIYSRWSYFSYQNPRTTISDINNKFSNLLKYKDINSDSNLYLLQQDYSKELLDNLNIKYVVVPTIDNSNDDNFWIYHGIIRNPNIREYYKNELDKIEWLKKIEIYNDLYVYENKNYQKLISIVNKDIDYSFKKLSNTSYIISVKNYKDQDLKILLSQEFNSNWHIAKYVKSKNYYFQKHVPISHSIENEYFMNSFNLNKADLCNTNCSETQDLIIYFKPQYYLNIGLAVSLGAFSLIPLLYLLNFIRNKIK